MKLNRFSLKPQPRPPESHRTCHSVSWQIVFQLLVERNGAFTSFFVSQRTTGKVSVFFSRLVNPNLSPYRNILSYTFVLAAIFATFTFREFHSEITDYVKRHGDVPLRLVDPMMVLYLNRTVEFLTGCVATRRFHILCSDGSLSISHFRLPLKRLTDNGGVHFGNPILFPPMKISIV